MAWERIDQDEVSKLWKEAEPHVNVAETVASGLLNLALNRPHETVIPVTAQHTLVVDRDEDKNANTPDSINYLNLVDNLVNQTELITEFHMDKVSSIFLGPDTDNYRAGIIYCGYSDDVKLTDKSTWGRHSVIYYSPSAENKSILHKNVTSDFSNETAPKFGNRMVFRSDLKFAAIASNESHTKGLELLQKIQQSLSVVKDANI